MSNTDQMHGDWFSPGSSQKIGHYAEAEKRAKSDFPSFRRDSVS